jgi:hypothetical protein
MELLLHIAGEPEEVEGGTPADAVVVDSSRRKAGGSEAGKKRVSRKVEGEELLAGFVQKVGLPPVSKARLTKKADEEPELA